jgi:hypothetical protein
MRTQLFGAVGAFALAASTLVAPAVSNAEVICGPNTYWNTLTNQCQLCEGVGMYWNVELNQCLFADPTPYVDPILGPVGPVGVGPNPVLGPVGPVGVGGVGPVVGPVGPVGVGGMGPVVGPVGPIGVGPR